MKYGNKSSHYQRERSRNKSLDKHLDFQRQSYLSVGSFFVDIILCLVSNLMDFVFHKIDSCDLRIWIQIIKLIIMVITSSFHNALIHSLVDMARENENIENF